MFRKLSLTLALLGLNSCTIFTPSGEPDDDAIVEDDDDSAAPADDDGVTEDDDSAGDDDSASDDDSAAGDDDSASGDDDSAETPVVDEDGDGYSTANSFDCDDSDASINPGAAEICDNIDQDCDGVADNGLPVAEYWFDQDGDGHGAGESQQNCGLAGFAPQGGDCNDTNDTVYPGATDVPGDGIDSDCDDEPVTPPTGDDDDSTAGDDDDDSTAADDDDATTPAPPVDSDGDGFSPGPSDCDDADPTINPGAAEICGNAVDENCDGVVATCPPPVDADADGASPPADCNDADASIYPGASETTPGIDDLDNDCDGLVDEVFQAQIEVTYPSSGTYSLSYQVYDEESDLGDWWDETVSVSNTLVVGDLLMSSGWDIEGSCGLRFNVAEGQPASDWFCAGSSLDPSVQVDIWWLGTWYDEGDLLVWNTPDPNDGGACSALLVIETSDPACVP